MDKKEVLIEVKDLKKYFQVGRNQTLKAVDGVNFKIYKGETLGIVGESGCGKTTCGKTVMGLYKATGGEVLFDGVDINKLNKNEKKEFTKRAQIIFQDPYSSLDPRKSVDATIREPLVVSGRYKKNEIDDATRELMEFVGIDERLRMSYPHELDGGRRQRVGIARALALNPDFVVCDEPVSALDVSIQAQVLNLLKKLQQQKRLTYMFVTHDMSVVRHISDEICVMYLGQMVEKCPSKELFKHPLHPYTQALLSAIPSVDIHHPMKREILHGEIISPVDPKPGCRFAARCKYATEACRQPQQQVEASPGHFVTCCRLNEIG